ncbi:T9SS type A sorting domain-containing protein [Bacteroides nordii]
MLNEEVQSGASAVSVGHLDKGIYIVRMQLSKRTISQKIIK